MPPIKGKNKKAQEQANQREHYRKRLDSWLNENNALDAQDVAVKATITADDAKQLLGWAEVEEDHHFIDENGCKVVCYNNAKNRAATDGDVEKIIQDILHRHYSYNGESIVFGNNGNLLSGQKRLKALVLAEQRRTGPNANHWAVYWDGPCFIEAIVVYNVDESMKTTRTLDNTRPRTVADALYTDPELSKYSPMDRRKIAKLLDVAIRTVWRRTGQADNLFITKITNAEMISFKERHPQIVKAVKHIFDEDGRQKRRISGSNRWISAGVAAGLLYLMGCSGSDEADYNAPKKTKANPYLQKNEKALDWSRWEQACEFFVMLASIDDSGKPLDPQWDEFIENLRKVRRPVDDPTDKENGYIFTDGSTQERAAALAKAWNVYRSDEKPTPGLFKMKWERSDRTGLHTLAEDPDVGGIDQGHNPFKPSVSLNGSGGSGDVTSVGYDYDVPNGQEEAAPQYELAPDDLDSANESNRLVRSSSP